VPFIAGFQVELASYSKPTSHLLPRSSYSSGNRQLECKKQSENIIRKVCCTVGCISVSTCVVTAYPSLRISFLLAFELLDVGGQAHFQEEWPAIISAAKASPKALAIIYIVSLDDCGWVFLF
jgi:hypothetical protein